MKAYGIGSVRGAFAAGFATAHGVPYPKGDRKRREALQKLHSDELLHEILRIEPRLQHLVDAAKYQQNGEGYNRIRTYYSLKNQALSLVGVLCHTKEIATWKHFDCVMRIVGDLLPEDDVDLYPEGKDE